jgi:alkylation response protein AidB-like acyl-CoA dehydrogenase
MSGDLADPSVYLDRETVAILRAHAPDAEAAKKLHDRQLEIIRGRKWFKLFVPVQWGGLGLTLPQALQLEEALAWADGSTAWVVTLCGGAGWFAGFIDPALRDELFASPETCLAGSGALGGTAEVSGSGYLINGNWPHASGAEHATAFTANCVLTSDGQPLLDADGGRQSAAFVFARNEVTVQRTWNSMGMTATGSHAFAVDQVAVPAVRRFQIEARRATRPELVYQYPFLPLAEATLAVNLSGLAARFLELATDLVGGPGNDARHLAQTKLLEARRELFASVDESWKLLEGERSVPERSLTRVSHASRQLATVSRQGVDAIYPFCGLRAADLGSEINRVWRNLHTAGQHALLRPAAG